MVDPKLKCGPDLEYKWETGFENEFSDRSDQIIQNSETFHLCRPPLGYKMILSIGGVIRVKRAETVRSTCYTCL